MIFCERPTLLFLLILVQSGIYDCSVVKRSSNNGVSGSYIKNSDFEKSLFDVIEEKNLEQEIMQELSHLSSRKQREIFNDLEKQHEKFNASYKSLVLPEPGNLSPLNVEELRSIQKTIKATNNSLPAIRNKRTLNFLLYAVARAMGYTLTPTNPDAEWIPRQQASPAQSFVQPCTSPPPSCRPNPSSTPPPCAIPPTSSPCLSPNAMSQSATIPPNRIDANTISYPYRPAMTIPLFNFAPLPAGVRVPYPPLLQPPAQQRSSCPPQQPSLPPCGNVTTPSSPPLMTTPTPRTSPPCRPVTLPPCGATPPSSPPPCGTTPAPFPLPCKPTPAPPCGTTPISSPPLCATTPMPPPCSNPAPAPTANMPPRPPPPPSEPPKKGTVILEYDDPVRIQIFSNGKKYLPASSSIYSGHDDDQKEDWHSSLTPGYDKEKKKDEDYDEKEEMEEEHFEEEEEEEEAVPLQLKHFEEDDERNLADEKDESETALSIVKKPAEEDSQKVNRRQLISSKTKTIITNDSGKKNKKEENAKAEKSPKMKTPKRKKWVRIVKKQRRKTKANSNPHNSFKVHSSDSSPQSSQVAPKFYEKRDSHSSFDSFERDVSDYSGDSSTNVSEDVTQIDLKKVIVNGKALNMPDYAVNNGQYDFNINPYALEPEEQRRKKLEKAVERYVEDYVEKQLGDELIKNTGVPKTTVFEFDPKNGPKIQTITTTVAKTSHPRNPVSLNLQVRPETPFHPKTPIRNSHFRSKNNYEENYNKRGDVRYKEFAVRT